AIFGVSECGEVFRRKRVSSPPVGYLVIDPDVASGVRVLQGCEHGILEFCRREPVAGEIRRIPIILVGTVPIVRAVIYPDAETNAVICEKFCRRLTRLDGSASEVGVQSRELLGRFVGIGGLGYLVKNCPHVSALHHALAESIEKIIVWMASPKCER